MPWRKRFCIAVGGNRWHIGEPCWRLWDYFPTPFFRWVRLLSAVACRFRGHVVDGLECSGFGGGECDVWCLRCFYWHARVPLDELPFRSRVVEITGEVVGPDLECEEE